jgi:sec-independent protein translocase protein TatB
MTGIAGSEIILLLLIGLVILGPERLPKVASQIGSWIGQARRMTRTMKRQLEDELRTEEWKKSPFEPHVPKDDDTYSPKHEKTPSTPVPGPSPVSANVKASEVSYPDEDEDDTIPPPAKKAGKQEDSPEPDA